MDLNKAKHNLALETSMMPLFWDSSLGHNSLPVVLRILQGYSSHGHYYVPTPMECLMGVWVSRLFQAYAMYYALREIFLNT